PTEAGVVEGIVQAREHQVLPDQDPELVAQLVERDLLVRPEAGQANHVHARGTEALERLAKVHVRRAQAHDVERGPQAPTGEDGNAIDVQGQSVAVDVVVGRRSGRDG